MSDVNKLGVIPGQGLNTLLAVVGGLMILICLLAAWHQGTQPWTIIGSGVGAVLYVVGMHRMIKRKKAWQAEKDARPQD